MKTSSRRPSALSYDVVAAYLKKYPKEWSDFKTIWPKVTEAYLYNIFTFNQEKWRTFKWIMKRISKGHLTEIWIEEKEMPRSLKLLRQVFQGTLVKDYEGYAQNYHIVKYYEE